MSATYSAFEYQFGGSLNSDSPSYVTRQADLLFYQALKDGQFCYVLNSRQMGKSSLRVRVMQRLQAEDIVCLFVDLTGMGKQDVTPEKWYAGIVQALASGCPSNSKIQWRDWWRERQEFLGPSQRLGLFIEEVLLVEISQKIVIFIDEIDRVLSQEFPLDDFFALIRFCLEQRAVNAQYQRLTFALLGVASPADLIRDQAQTPFNIGKAIELKGFEIHEAQALIAGLHGVVEHPEAMMRDILNWTGGQPFLTQKLCQLVVAASTGKGSVSVEQVVRSQVLESWEFQDEPEHLKTIRDRLLRNQAKMSRLLGLYRRILEQSEISADGSPEQMELRLTGLVVERHGKLKVYNRICQRVFDLSWVEQKLAQMRPYREAIAQWLASEGSDLSCLLQGQPLQDAMAWALGKSLSDQDFQFLVASQNLAKQQAQLALEDTEQASRLLALARQHAKHKVLKHRLRWDWIPKITLAVTTPILVLRFCGLFQGLEWNLLDEFIRTRPLEPPDNRIALVTINESDLAKVERWPMPDRVLAQSLRQINAQRPRAIGLDIYRDLPVEPGYQELTQAFRSIPNLYGIEKVVGARVRPPHTLAPNHQIGFSDQVLDADNKVRRALLTVDLSHNDLRYSLALQLALHYLKEAGVNPKEADDNKMHLGKASFHPLEENDGGYVRTQLGGYQVLLNFRGPQSSFPCYSLSQVLDGKLPTNALRDRLVLMGTTAESLNDVFYTPYSGGLFQSPDPMAGVILHANITSQILSAALDGRPLLRTWNDYLEWVWIAAWAALGGMISWRFRALGLIAVGTILASGILAVGCFLVFLWGWWLPLAPALLGLVGTATILPMAANRQRDKLLFQQTFAGLLNIYPNYPIAARIALEYLKQSETKENQALIEQQLHLQGEATEYDRTTSIEIGSSPPDLRKSAQIPLRF